MRDADAKTLLIVYLQDHHAGSVGGIELAKRCAEQNTQEPLGGLLRTFVESLQVTGLAREVMAHLDIAPSPVKSPMALVAERVGRAELNGQLVFDTCGCAATTACPLWAASPLAGAAHNHGFREATCIAPAHTVRAVISSAVMDRCWQTQIRPRSVSVAMRSLSGARWRRGRGRGRR